MFIEEIRLVKDANAPEQRSDSSSVPPQPMEAQIQRFEDKNRLALFKAYLESTEHQPHSNLMVIRDESNGVTGKDTYCLSEISHDKCPSIQILN